MRLSPSILALTLAAALGAAGPGLAAPACSLPAGLAPAPRLDPPADQVVKGVTIAYYLLSLNWTPQWCRAVGERGTEQAMECGQAFGFTLHRLWPNGAAPPYPRYCNPVGRLDAAQVRSMYCRTPSAELLQHEWQAHGACGWTDPGAYFGQASKLFDRLAIPKIETIPAAGLTAGAVRQAFVAKNPWLTPAALFVQTSRGGALNEVRVCYDLKYRPAACPGGNGAPDRTHLTLAPSRTGAF